MAGLFYVPLGFNISWRQASPSSFFYNGAIVGKIVFGTL
jgi:hypothetical protein